MKKKDLFKTKKITVLFAAAALIGGFLFLNPSITGGFALENKDSVNLLSIIGLSLIGCAIVLAAYSLKKK